MDWRQGINVIQFGLGNWQSTGNNKCSYEKLITDNVIKAPSILFISENIKS